MLTQYTNYDDIRAALGVAPEEITDDVLSLPSYELILKFDLEELGGAYSPTFLEEYATITASPYSETASVNENNYADTLRLYATYALAFHLLVTLDMFAPKTIKDAKTELERVTDPYKEIRAGVEGFYWLMRARLLAAYLLIFPSTVAPNPVKNVYMVGVPLAADPVTGI